MSMTGWSPGMLQDDSPELSRWLADRPDARRQAREAASAISVEANELVRNGTLLALYETVTALIREHGADTNVEFSIRSAPSLGRNRITVRLTK